VRPPRPVQSARLHAEPGTRYGKNQCRPEGRRADPARSQSGARSAAQDRSQGRL